MIVRNPSWGSSGCLNFVTWSATPHFVAFFSFASDYFMVSPASFQVGCRSYIPFVVYFARNDVNSVSAWTGDVPLYGPMSTVPRKYKNSSFFWMATRVTPFFARTKTWSVLGPMLNISLWNSRLVHLCEIFSFSVSRDDSSWGKDLFINYVGMKKMEIFLDYSRFGRHSAGRKCSPRRFSCHSFSWAGLGVFLFLRPFHKSLISFFVLPSGDGPYSSSLRSNFLRHLVLS